MSGRFNPEEYITVHERVEKFYAKYPQGRVTTHILEHNFETGFILIRAEVFRSHDDALPAATGHAYELRSSGHVQQGSYVEVCETSAVGRALALLGFEVRRGIAGREEAQKAARAGGGPKRSPEPAPERPPAGTPETNLSELHKRINGWRGKLVAEGFRTNADLQGMLEKYGRRRVEDLDRGQALKHGAELKTLYEGLVRERVEQVKQSA